MQHCHVILCLCWDHFAMWHCLVVLALSCKGDFNATLSCYSVLVLGSPSNVALSYSDLVMLGWHCSATLSCYSSLVMLG